MFALMAATAAQAQVLNQYGNSFNEDFSGCGVIPAKYSSDSKAYLVTTDQGDKNTQLSVYDDKLNKVKTIDIAEPENARGYAIEKERGEVTKVVMTNYDKGEEFDEWKDWMLDNGLAPLTLEEAKSYIASINFNIGSTYVNEDTTFMLSSSQYDYLSPEVYEQKYPVNLYFYIDGKLYKRENNWTVDDWGNPSEVKLTWHNDFETSDWDWKQWKKENNLLSLSLDEAKSYLASGWRWGNFSVDSTSVSADTTYLFSFNPEYYFSDYEEDFGRMYPTYFFAYSSDGKLFSQNKSYRIIRSYTGEWEETKEEYGYYDDYPENIHIMNYNESPDYEEGITLTQTLFNNDDAYEYIMPVLTIEANNTQEEDRDGDGETDYIRTYYAPRANAFKVVSDNGNTLQTVNMPTGLSFGAIYLLNINDEQYLLCHASKKEDYRDSYSIFYTIGNNGGSTQIQQVGEPMRTRVHPTVAGRNETITVELDGNGNGEKEIFVSNAAGQTVYKSKVAAGQKQVLINASGLSRGMNIISVRGGKGKTNSNKVIVK